MDTSILPLLFLRFWFGVKGDNLNLQHYKYLGQRRVASIDPITYLLVFFLPSILSQGLQFANQDLRLSGTLAAGITALNFDMDNKLI